MKLYRVKIGQGRKIPQAYHVLLVTNLSTMSIFMNDKAYFSSHNNFNLAAPTKYDYSNKSNSHFKASLLNYLISLQQNRDTRYIYDISLAGITHHFHLINSL